MQMFLKLFEFLYKSCSHVINIKSSKSVLFVVVLKQVLIILSFKNVRSIVELETGSIKAI